MKQLTLLSLLILTFSSVGNTQEKKTKDQKAIKDMCGCYEVKFKYAETFSPDIAYEKAYDYRASALEWAELVVDKENKIGIQHLLIVNDTMVIKHWRQDWEFQNQYVFNYKSKNTWGIKKFSKEDVSGQWTQKAYQVDDSPRYSGSATWVHVDGKSYWANKTDAPLPRREYSKRDDYNIMNRGNNVQLTGYGWLHEQDNDKIIRVDGEKDELLVQEKGYNIYRKIADEKCKLAKDWWKKNNKIWKKVRQEWDHVLAKNKEIKLKEKVDDKKLYQYLFALENNANKKDIEAIINQFLN
ncbi:DUF6607 family protein [Flavivirga rizhaonensis]|uniref:Uncharacterized protein n=1 Tax=Flavivirga rizhaonensis TaxID=2559571 RepID=A0A4S1DUI5_9FLAO|nr:DUF6607 family protein [Flavivirga rizhaonensis]TGV01751.1 hypothetical protein EM932_13830 [Flavivirga rizhaonensis]